MALAGGPAYGGALAGRALRRPLLANYSALLAGVSGHFPSGAVASV
jgi:hypothetical protein